MKTKKILQLQILFFCMVSVLCLMGAWRNDTATVLPDSDGLAVFDLVNIYFEKDTACISADVLENVPDCEKSFELLKSGDFAFTYKWPYQTAIVKTCNTEKCQFECPEDPEITFTRISGNVYNAVVSVVIPYTENGRDQTVRISKNFAAFVTD